MSFVKLYKKIRLNKDIIQDKIHAAWIGKNIGGTFGGPYEGTHDFLDVKDFATEAGVPMPNDDLDLQLVWLYALENEGPWNFSARVLSEYWLSAVVPHWAEYGYAKANLRSGLPPMLSGAMHNERFKHSNGAWIRSEIWACLAPGFPGIARKLAFEDAQIDHGLGEGTYAELFTATMQSAAFFECDRRRLVECALASIPQESRVAHAVAYVMAEYDKGTPYRAVRDALIEDSRDLGWFMAPANIGFVIIGLLYGEGDFKRSMIYATNCGDDTDCTAATLGATLGIMYGTAGIPEDWRRHVGDGIVTICIGTTHTKLVAKSCTELTERVMRMIPSLFLAEGFDFAFTDGECEIEEGTHAGVTTAELFERAPWSFDVVHNGYMKVVGEYDRAPTVRALETITLTLRFENIVPDSCSFAVKLILPDGFTAEYPHSFVMGDWFCDKGKTWSATVTVGERLEAMNHVYAIFTPHGHAQPIIADFVLEG